MPQSERVHPNHLSSSLKGKSSIFPHLAILAHADLPWQGDHSAVCSQLRLIMNDSSGKDAWRAPFHSLSWRVYQQYEKFSTNLGFGSSTGDLAWPAVHRSLNPSVDITYRLTYLSTYLLQAQSSRRDPTSSLVCAKSDLKYLPFLYRQWQSQLLLE
jgi:hypothetical protein